MKKPLLFCFSGQGSQYYQMAKGLYQEGGVFRDCMDQLDAQLMAMGQASVCGELYRSDKKLSDPFDQLIVTHPAIFMVEYALCIYLQNKGLQPDCVMGASLGEFVAAVVSGILPTETALSILLKNAQSVEGSCPPAGMMAVIAPVENFDRLHRQFPDLELAATNSDKHFVIAAPNESMVSVASFLQASDILFQRLPVSWAFHSSLVDSAASENLDFLQTLAFRRNRIPQISCCWGEFLDDSVDLAKRYFWDICRKPILIKKAIATAEKAGPYIYIDLGPSGTFVNFVNQNLPADSGSKTLTLLSPFGQDRKIAEKIDGLLENIEKEYCV